MDDLKTKLNRFSRETLITAVMQLAARVKKESLMIYLDGLEKLNHPNKKTEED